MIGTDTSIKKIYEPYLVTVFYDSNFNKSNANAQS